MSGSSTSLLTFLDAPVIVVDPDGRVVYVNPAFESSFSMGGEAVTGQPLAALFEGGGREAVLRAVAEVCAKGKSTRFRLRHGDSGYATVVSPIVSEDDRVGVVMLLAEVTVDDERILAFHREIREPLELISGALEKLFEQTGGRRADRYRELVADAMLGLGRLRKWADEFRSRLAGEPVRSRAESTFDPLRIVDEAAARVGEELSAAGVAFEVLASGTLPKVYGDGPRLQMALVRLLRDRLARPSPPASLALEAKCVEEGDASSVLVSIIDGPGEEAVPGEGAEDEPLVFRELVEDLGGRLETRSDSGSGAVISIRLRIEQA